MDIVEYKGGKLYRSQAQFFEQIEKASPSNLRIRHFCRNSNDSNPPLSDQTIFVLCEAGGGPFNIRIASYDSNVVGLSISAFNFKRIPNSINALKELSYMVVDRSRVLESLPNTIGELNQLKTLKVIRCPKLQNIPDNIGNLKSLKLLDFWGCRIEELPNSMGNLLALEYLRLVDNRIGDLPESIGQLKNLIKLDLGGFSGGNNLTNLPESIGQLRNLIKLDLGYNELQSLPDSIGNLSRLEELVLKRNNLTILPETIGKLTSLKKLWLSKNNLQTVPSSLKTLKSIEILDLSSNQIEIFPEVLKHLPKSTKLFLEDNPLNNKLIIDSNNLLEKLVNNNLCGSIFTWNNKDASLIGDLFEGMKHTVIKCDNASVYSYYGPQFGKDNVLVIGSKGRDDAINLLMLDFLSDIDPEWIDKLRANIGPKGDLESYLKTTFSKNLESGFSTDIYIGTLTYTGEDYVDIPTALKEHLERYRNRKF
jgi:Leucine-rich repeat (LRR) protein